MCANLRRTARALTQLYEDAIRPFGLRATQFTILQALSLTGEITQGKLGHILALDSTTLTRTLDLMERQGWVAKRYGKDRRERWLRLAPDGEAQFRRAEPAWQQVQDQLRSRFGNENWNSLMGLAQQATELVTA